VVANNYIHHVNSYSYGGWGLYTDEGSSDMLWENNLVHDTKSGGFHQHYGANNIIRNNILAYSREAQVQRSREDVRCHIIFERNLVYCDNDQVLIRRLKNGDYKFDHNIYWTTAKSDALFDDRTWDEWRATSSQDQNSLFADPLFENPEQRDFRLKPNSPAFKIGFKPIDLSGVGLYGDPAWMAKPKSVTRPEFNLPATAAPTTAGLHDDFENAEVGQKPKGAVILGESGAASVRVTRETAASGKQSLKFVDAPGLVNAHDPLMQYKPACRQGVYTGSFDVRMEAGALFWHEWRDSASPYKRGPSIKITDKGVFQSGGSNLCQVPLGKWLHVEITCGLGTQSTGTYDVAVTIPGQAPQKFAKLSNGSKDFKTLQWYGFVSLGKEAGTFYLDNLKLAKR
jgi:hypothetical protein